MKRELSLLLLALAVGFGSLLVGQPTREFQNETNGVEHADALAQGYGRWREPNRSGNNSGLPQGRRYYNGRYFGNLNNRYYGPQYGYF